MTSGPDAGAGLFAALARAGFLAPCEAGRWRVVAGGSEGGFEHAGNVYLPLDVSALPPFYQETYRDIVARRLERSGFGDGTGVAYRGGLILAWVPAPVMRQSSPSHVAASRLADADGAWVDEVEREFREASQQMEERADAVWIGLLDGRASAPALRALLDAKVALNALAIDSLVPPPALLRAWLAPHLAPDLVTDVVDGCLVPASGYVAYDVYEDECWRLAAAFLRAGHLPGTARRRFVQQGLFLQFDSLDTTRTRELFDDYPTELAVRFAAVAGSGPGAVAARREEIRERSWRRRLHRSWASAQFGPAEGDEAGGRRPWIVHRFLGLARDFDEEKRRLNAKLWRNLVALAGAVGVPLPTATQAELLTALERSGGTVTIDADLTGEADPDEA